jgi:hypothetical protein
MEGGSGWWRLDESVIGVRWRLVVTSEVDFHPY